MTKVYEYKKPPTVRRSEYVLLTWTAWTCFYGIYDTWVGIPAAMKGINDQLQQDFQGQYSLAIETSTIMNGAVGFYALVAVVSLFFIYKLAQGKPWARSSFLWGFIAETVCSLIWTAILFSFGTPPGLVDWLAYIPDYGAQIYALYLLYTWPGKRWFERAAVVEYE